MERAKNKSIYLFRFVEDINTEVKSNFMLREKKKKKKERKVINKYKLTYIEGIK